MNKIVRWTSVLAAVTLGFAAAAQAQDGKDLAKSHACFTCHAMAGSKVGPGFAEIAAKFAGKPNAAQTLAEAMEHGEKGTFGAMPMPAQAGLTDSDAKLIADWILSQKK